MCPASGAGVGTPCNGALEVAGAPPDSGTTGPHAARCQASSPRPPDGADAPAPRAGEPSQALTKSAVTMVAARPREKRYAADDAALLTACRPVWRVMPGTLARWAGRPSQSEAAPTRLSRAKPRWTTLKEYWHRLTVVAVVYKRKPTICGARRVSASLGC